MAYWHAYMRCLHMRTITAAAVIVLYSLLLSSISIYSKIRLTTRPIGKCWRHGESTPS